MPCRACKRDHSPLVACSVARKQAEYQAMRDAEMVVHKDAMVVHTPVSGSSQASNGSSRHGVYADMDKRRAYRREWMARRRSWS